MIIEELHAWVLHKRRTGETSLHVTLLTYEQGIVSAWFKGVLKRRTLLQSFVPFWVAVHQGKTQCYIRQADMLDVMLPLQGERLFAALYANELVYMSLRPNDPCTVLYQAYETLLYGLVSVQDKIQLEAALRRFEFQLLKTCGVAMSLSDDVEGQRICEDRYYEFLPGEGFRASTSGFSGKHLLLFAQDVLHDPRTLQSIKQLMRLAIHYHLEGKPIKTRQLWMTQQICEVNDE